MRCDGASRDCKEPIVIMLRFTVLYVEIHTTTMSIFHTNQIVLISHQHGENYVNIRVGVYIKSTDVKMTAVVRIFREYFLDYGTMFIYSLN